MTSHQRRVLVLAAAAMCVFAAVATILLRVIPSPHKDSDYLVIGTLATFAALLVVFVVLLTTFWRDPTAFFKRRKS
jgi:uncharacterized membrane protein